MRVNMKMARPMRFRRDMRHFLGVVGGVVEPKALRTGERVVQGSIDNVISAVVVTLIYRKHVKLLRPSPSKNEYRPSMSTFLRIRGGGNNNNWKPDIGRGHKQGYR